MTKKKTTTVKPTANTSYSGQLKISLLKGKKVIKSNIYHNEGTSNLFYGMALALIGDSSGASMYLPKYLALYDIGDVGTTISTVAPPTSGGKNLIVPGRKTSLSTIVYSDAPYVKSESGASSTTITDRATITYKFLIPFTQIDTTNEKPTNCLVLYSKPNEPENYLLAYSMIINTDTSGNQTLGNLIDTTKSVNDYNLLVQWTMNLTNG